MSARPDGPRAGGAGRALVTAVLVIVVLAATAVAAALAAARVLSPGILRGIELVALTPAGLPAAVVALVGALLLLWRRPALGRPLLVLALGLAALHAWWLAPLFVGDVPAADPSGARLVVMTQNLETGDAGAVAALVEQQSVDVLVVTDAPAGQVQGVVAAGVGDVLPHSTLDEGTGTSSGTSSGSVVWSRHPIRSDTLVSDGGDSRVVVLDVPGPDDVAVVALHPTPPYQDGGARWRADWTQVLDDLRETYGDTVTGRVVVVGDLNATLDHEPVRALSDMGLRDVAEQLNAGLAATWPANGRLSRMGVAVPPLVALDHVLTTRALVPTDHLLTGAAGSDHRGVVTTLAPAAR